MERSLRRPGDRERSVAMKDTTKPVADSNARYRIHVTFATAVILGIAGFAIGWSIPTRHPDDRLADVLLPASGLTVLGALLGYVISSVYYRRLSAVDAFACIAIPVFTFSGFFLGKSGDWFRYRVLSFGAFAMLAYLGLRVYLSQMSKRNHNR